MMCDSLGIIQDLKNMDVNGVLGQNHYCSLTITHLEIPGLSVRRRSKAETWLWKANRATQCSMQFCMRLRNVSILIDWFNNVT